MNELQVKDVEMQSGTKLLWLVSLGIHALAVTIAYVLFATERQVRLGLLNIALWIERE